MNLENLTPKQVELMQDYIKFAPKEPRENLIKLVGKIRPTEVEKGVDSWAYIFFNRQLDDEMIDFCLNFDMRKPLYIEEVARRAGMSVGRAAELGAKAANIGVLEYWYDENKVDRLSLCDFVVGSMEQAVLADWRMAKFPEMSVCFDQYALQAMPLTPFYPMANGGIHRPVPTSAAVMNETKRASWEEIETLIDESSNGIYGLSKCICRKMHEQEGEGDGNPEKEWCCSLGHYADYLIRTGKARPITREELMDVIKEADERGFVHNVSNANKGEIEYVCNCDFRSCMSLRASGYGRSGSVQRSNFQASVDPEKCMACGSCVEVCPSNAVQLGQRLAPKCGTIDYPDTVISTDELQWDSSHYNPDYRWNRKTVREESGTSPCKSSCPAHIAIAAYMKLASQGKFREALEIIKKDNPFPAICGSICNHRCEDACTRGGVDQPIAIDNIKKSIAWQELEAEKRYIPKIIHKTGHKMAVIGAGPAGLSCAYYLATLGHKVTVFEKESLPGGMMRYGIPSFRLEKNIIDAEIDVLRRLDIEIMGGIEIGKDYSLDNLRDMGFKAIYLGIGAQKGRRLGLTGEDADGCMPGIDYMRKALSPDGYPFHGKVVVIGGGNVALDIARTAIRSGAESVNLYSLEKRDVMPASVEEIEVAEAEGIVINDGWGPAKIECSKGKVTGVEFKKCISTLDAAGHFSPAFDESVKRECKTDYLLYCVGQAVEWGNMLERSAVELNGNKTAKADNFTYQTAQPDVFVGGDAYTGPKFVIDAVAAGKQAAESMHRFAWQHDLRSGRNLRNYNKQIESGNVDLSCYDAAERQKPSVAMKRVNGGLLTAEQIRMETSRCLRCGAAHVDKAMCIGCGACTTQCEFDAITLHKEYNYPPITTEERAPLIMAEIQRRTVKMKASQQG